jgi:hypothetical protein
MLNPVRRIVTGHNSEGRSIVLSDAEAENIFANPLQPDRGLTNLWRMTDMPANNAGDADPVAGAAIGLEPAAAGNVFRIVQIPPESQVGQLSREELVRRARETFAALGAPHAYVDSPRHPAMHRTRTVDYVILLKGEVTMLLDEGEVRMKPFDVVIQRGTSHAWVNHGDEPAILAGVMIAAKSLSP